MSYTLMNISCLYCGKKSANKTFQGRLFCNSNWQLLNYLGTTTYHKNNIIMSSKADSFWVSNWFDYKSITFMGSWTISNLYTKPVEVTPVTSQCTNVYDIVKPLDWWILLYLAIVTTFSFIIHFSSIYVFLTITAPLTNKNTINV